ncbi:hypothetical protein [Nocardiopsis xinjiangensis]|uniref:hypothetical protein n=1 Tax=Nocardiopsis xinjiangensis TaxID=124285 RepID=UPI0013787273|nr:hypothetical protein [Nocardiopsis xinjiangensis]
MQLLRLQPQHRPLQHRSIQQPEQSQSAVHPRERVRHPHPVQTPAHRIGRLHRIQRPLALGHRDRHGALLTTQGPIHRTTDPAREPLPRHPRRQHHRQRRHQDHHRHVLQNPRATVRVHPPPPHRSTGARPRNRHKDRSMRSASLGVQHHPRSYNNTRTR